MPKTFTSDVGSALPSSVAGPFQVVDADDPSNSVTLDPAGGPVAVAGVARPKRTVSAPFNRTHQTGASSLIGATVAARFIGAGFSGGFLASPVGLPDDADGDAAVNVFAVVSPGGDATVNGQVIRFELVATRAEPGGTKETITITFDWNVPDDWTTSEVAAVLIDNGNGRTFDPGQLQPGDVVGLRMARLGADAADTFDEGIKLAESILLQYTANRL